MNSAKLIVIYKQIQSVHGSFIEWKITTAVHWKIPSCPMIFAPCWLNDTATVFVEAKLKPQRNPSFLAVKHPFWMLWVMIHEDFLLAPHVCLAVHPTFPDWIPHLYILHLSTARKTPCWLQKFLAKPLLELGEVPSRTPPPVLQWPCRCHVARRASMPWTTGTARCRGAGPRPTLGDGNSCGRGSSGSPTWSRRRWGCGACGVFA